MASEISPIELVPLLVVRGAERAIDFYVEAFAAREPARRDAWAPPK
jgi:uncharacterized glyoxalase superfamily protein PhnB